MRGKPKHTIHATTTSLMTTKSFHPDSCLLPMHYLPREINAISTKHYWIFPTIILTIWLYKWAPILTEYGALQAQNLLV